MDQIARAVSGRLRDKTEEERRAVTLYISSLMKTKDSEEKTPVVRQNFIRAEKSESGVFRQRCKMSGS